MLISNMAGTGDDNLLNTEEKDMEYRKLQLQKLKEEVLDLEDLREGVSITDLGLNDFRIDLANFVKEYGEQVNVPEGLHAVVRSSPLAPPGAIFVLKNINDAVNINKLNRLHPFYLVYMQESGEVFLNHVDSKKILDAMRMLCRGNNEPLIELCTSVSNATDDYHDMEQYSGYLKQAVKSIVSNEEEKEVLSLFSAGGTTALQEKFKGVEDFKLISFLIVR